MTNYLLYQLLRIFILFIVWYVVVMNGATLVQMIVALFVTPGQSAGSRNDESTLKGVSENMVPISVLVPAFDEEAAIVESVKSLLNLNYPGFEVVVINDGSKDSTLETVINAFGLHKVTYPVREQLATKKVRGIYYNPDIPRLRLIDKENGGKSDALNAGINLSRYPYFMSLGADSLLDADALLRVAMIFMRDKYTSAVGGTMRVANGCTIKDGKITEVRLPRKIWPLFQTIEYFRAFLVSHIVWNSLDSLLVISGGFGAFQKEPVLLVGGYNTGTIGGDIDLVIRIHKYMKARRYKYRVSFLPDPVCWTQVPESLDLLCEQRRYWQIGLMDVLGRYRGMLLDTRFGLPGFLSLSYNFLFEMLSPVLELLGYVLVPLGLFLGVISLNTLALFYLAAVAFGVISSIGALVVEELTRSEHIRVRDLLRLSLLCIPENLFYRQLTVFFRFLGILSYRKYKREWGLMKRQKPGGADAEN